MSTPERSVRVAELVASLTLEEKAALMAGADFWSTVAVPRLGLPSVRVTDGPNGARGPVTRGEGGLHSVCVPCGTALGASWDTELLGRIGALLGTEARRKACRVLLAPTVNLHRSPLAGRNFECYSEDPVLSGALAAAFVRGVQSQGVATTVKHLVGNEAETERTSMSSEIDERTLRELYLVPFEAAIRVGGSLGVMTAYNRLNGIWCTEDRALLEGVLREEWGFEGLVVTDWYGVTTTTVSPAAGVDLEMPGPARAYGPALAGAVADGRVEEDHLDAALGRLLGVLERVGALDDAGDEQPSELDDPAERALAAEAAAAGMVLLTNDGTLPVDPAGLRSVAVLGPNAGRAVIMGGGSSHVQAFHRTSPLEALRAHLGPGVAVEHAPGVDIARSSPPLRGEVSVEMRAGWDLDAPATETATWRSLRMLSFGPPAGLPTEMSLRARVVLTPERSGPHRLTLQQAGRARVLLDGAVAIDAMTTPPPPGRSFLGFGSREVAATVALEEGRPVEVVVEYTSEGTSGVYGVEVGLRAVLADDAMDQAVALAAASDLAVVVVGTDEEWESEGFDRRSMDLPGDQDELIARVAEANPRTVVVVNAGAPVTMDWAERPAAVLQVWFGGQEMGSALAQVLTGESEPGGRLPTTIPQRLEHSPAFGAFPGDHDVVRYGEGVLVGHRWYTTRHLPVRFGFGHGLSYGRFEVGAPEVTGAAPSAGPAEGGPLARVVVDDRPGGPGPADDGGGAPNGADAAGPGAEGPGGELVLRIPVRNVGDRAGSEVVQVYVAPPERPSVPRPAQELRAFAKVHLGPGESTTVTVGLGARAFAHWDVGSAGHAALLARLPLSRGEGGPDRSAGWWVDPGRHEVQVARAASAVLHRVPVEVTAADP